MLHLDLTRIFEARNISKHYSYLRQIGFPHTTANLLASGNCRSPRLDWIEKLCVHLKCLPNDILTWEPAAGADENIPLATLKSTGKNGAEWVAKLKNMPLDRLREIGEILSKELE